MGRFGIIGDPVAGSLSPVLFKAAYGGRHSYELIEGSDFEVSWQRFLEGYNGINVTAPFKEKAFARADIISEVTSRIRAVNLVVKTPDGQLEAHNTDFCGIVLCILSSLTGLRMQVLHTPVEVQLQAAREAVSELYPMQPKALVIGCGGAGRAAAVAAAETGYSVTLINRTLLKAAAIASEMPAYRFRVQPVEELRKCIGESELIIYTAPAAFAGLDTLSWSDFTPYHPGMGAGKILLEAGYKAPVFSGDLRRMLSRAGCQYVSGRQWLLYQAATGYAFFTGENPDFAAMAKELQC